MDQRVALVGQRLKTTHCTCPAAPVEQAPEPMLAGTQAQVQDNTYAPLPPPPPVSRPDYTPHRRAARASLIH